MLPALLVAVAVITPNGVPSSVRAECEEHAAIIEQIKYSQVRGKTVAETAIDLGLEDYEELVWYTYNEISTPKELRKRAYATCLKVMTE